MKMIGIGIDLVEVRRVRRLASKNPRFLKRLFSEEELRYCQARKNRWQHLAVRFAAKEAVWKALDRSGVRLKDIVVSRHGTGKPAVKLKSKSCGRYILHVSLSHTKEYATAMAIAYKNSSR